MSRRILISGASIAGNCLAWWLTHHGDVEVVVAEAAPGFRDGGQNVDVRGIGRDVLRRMGLEAAATAASTGEEGTAWLRPDKRVVARILTDASTGDGPTAEMEILRGDLARLLFDAVGDRATFRFGTTIAAVAPDDTGVHVTFADGSTERFDLLLVAEGVGSPTRERLFPGENRPRWMDLTIAFGTIPRTPADDRLWRIVNLPGGRTAHLRPDRHGTARAMLSVQGPHAAEHRWDMARQKRWLHERFAGAGWEVPRILAGFDATDDFYFDALRQVRMPRWSHGRVALTGDAAWCVTPIAGMGSTLALVGAYVLAGELSRTDDHAAAFAGYDRVMRPLVERAGNIPKIGPRLFNPRSRAAIAVLHGVVRLASAAPVRRLFAALGRRKTVPTLPSY